MRLPKPAENPGRRLLELSLLCALNTANARRPITASERLATAGFLPGWITSELPLHTIGWQAAASAALLKKGAWRSRAGLAGLGISAFSWAALAKMWSDSNRSAELFERAFIEGLGDPLAGAPSLSVPERRRRLALGPISNHGRGYKQARNLRYGEFGRRNFLDVWSEPETRPGDGRPVLLQVHGGAWSMGNKEQQAQPLMAEMSKRGWVCVSINYRLSPRSKWPDHIVDVKRALAWVKANIADYGGDPEFVAITGGSAGGHLSSLTALTMNEPEFQPGFESADTSVVAAVPFYGVFDWLNRDATGLVGMRRFLERTVVRTALDDDPETWRKASTMSWIRPDAPPFMIVHGSNDTLVPVAQARSFVDQLRSVSTSPVVYAELPGAQHAFDVFDSRRSLATVDAVSRFLDHIKAETASSARELVATP